MASFNDLLNKIHSGVAAASLSIDSNDAIIINADRSFTIPENFNRVIAYEGDVNSQVVTFKCEKIVEGHNLFECQEKRLRWKNVSSGHEGSSKLIAKGEANTLILEWQAPAEAFSKTGRLEISISIFDLLDKQIAYSWNTAVLRDLSVGESLDSVGHKIGYSEQDHTVFDYIPSKSEILTISAETRKITAPLGYNNTFCNYGDVGTSIVYFQTNRYVRGIDILDENTHFRMYWKLDKLANIEDSTTTKNLYAVPLEGRDSEGLVNIIWKPSKAITNNSLFYFGAITIQLEIHSADKIWRTAPYNALEIGKSEFSEYVTDLPESEGEVNGYIIDGAVTLSDKVVNTVAGVVKLRTCSATAPVLIRKNELVIENDDNGNYVGVKIGTKDGESSLDSPYVAYAPEVIIRLHGGDASDE